jgi:NhaP-type Na+/H+ or K+/H+ antiporter
MYISSIFSSSDIIAAVTLVKFEEQPKLFSIILGEGLFNDAAAVILYQAMKNIAEMQRRGNGNVEYSNIRLYTDVITNFLKLSSCSIAIGLVLGFLCSYITK